MAEWDLNPPSTLRIRRTFPSPRERVFKAWTDPRELKKWWKIGDSTLTIVELNLRMGGNFRIGLKPSTSDSVHLVRGTFREVMPPERLVYTWVVEDPSMESDETLVTVEFYDRGKLTEVVLTHQLLKDRKLRESIERGWLSVLEGLAKLLG